MGQILGGAHADTGGERLQAGAPAHVRELVTMMTAEPETGLVFPHNAASFDHPLLSTRAVATIESIMPALICEQTNSRPSLGCAALAT